MTDDAKRRPAPVRRPFDTAPRGLKLALDVLERLVDAEDDLPKVLDRVLGEVVRATRADRGFVLLREVGRGLVVHAARDERGLKIAHDEREVSRALAKRAAEEDQTLRITHAGADPRLAGSESIKRLGVRSAIAAPLKAGEERFGAVVVDRRVAGVPELGETEEKLVTAFARAASKLILRARRIEVERGRARALEELLAGLGGGALAPSAAQSKEPPEVDRGALLGDSPGMQLLLREIGRIRRTHARVLITGESGSGKELVARAVHRNSPRARGPFVAVNCGALSDSLLEDELFGHEKGAFSGAERARDGLFVEADGGTLFLDEVGEASPKLQRALLRVLETAEVRPLAGDPVKVDVRVVAATHRDLASLVAAGRFRHDLLYRIDVVRLRVPPLRERPEDVEALARAFAVEACRGDLERAKALDARAVAELKRHRWPGNIRELKNAVVRLVTTGDLRLEAGSAAPPETARERRAEEEEVVSLAETEKRAILQALEATHGNVAETARKLGVSRRGLYYLFDQHGLRDWRERRVRRA